MFHTWASSGMHIQTVFLPLKLSEHKQPYLTSHWDALHKHIYTLKWFNIWVLSKVSFECLDQIVWPLNSIQPAFWKAEIKVEKKSWDHEPSWGLCLNLCFFYSRVIRQQHSKKQTKWRWKCFHIFLLLLSGKSKKCECSAFRFDFQFILLSKLDQFLCFLSVGSNIISTLKYSTSAITLLPYTQI